MSDWYLASSHKFCGNCGTSLAKSHEYTVFYEHSTGDPVVHYQLSCPRWRWWRPWHFKEEFRGEDMIVNYDYI